MKLAIHEIPKDGLHIDKMVDPQELDLYSGDVEAFSPISVKAQLDRVGSEVIARVHANGKFQIACARCLEPIDRQCGGDFIFDYPFEKETDQIDLGDDIRQEILLSIISRQLCKEDCKGLCPECGANLNIEKCKCKAKAK